MSEVVITQADRERLAREWDGCGHSEIAEHIRSGRADYGNNMPPLRALARLRLEQEAYHRV